MHVGKGVRAQAGHAQQARRGAAWRGVAWRGVAWGGALEGQLKHQRSVDENVQVRPDARHAAYFRRRGQSARGQVARRGLEQGAWTWLAGGRVLRCGELE